MGMRKTAWGKEFGRLVQMARQEAGLTRAELCQRTGFAKNYFSSLENGHFMPSGNAIERIAQALPDYAAAIRAHPAGAMVTEKQRRTRAELESLPRCPCCGQVIDERKVNGRA